jgi:hypothetical protein
MLTETLVVGMDGHSAIRIAKPYRITKIEEQAPSIQIDEIGGDEELNTIQPISVPIASGISESQASLLTRRPGTDS